MSRWALAALFALGSEAALAAPRVWGPLRPGPHGVGFRTWTSGPVQRPVQVSTWYPARESDAPTLSYRDYIKVTAAERARQAPTEAAVEETVERYARFMAGNGLSAAAVTAWLEAPMAARREALPAAGAFPLVLVAQGNGGAAPDHALLGEFLASRGYVVATSPSPARLGDAVESEADILPVAEIQAHDLAFVAAQLGALPFVDAGRRGVVGYSFGGRAALLFLADKPGVAAFVSLDSGVGARAGREWLPSRRLVRSAVRTPILHVFEDSDDALTPDFALLAACTSSDRTLLRVADLHHFEFLTYGMASATLPEMGGDRDGRRLARKLEAVFIYAGAFLDAYLKHDPEARAFLLRAPTDNGFPDLGLTASRLPPGR